MGRACFCGFWKMILQRKPQPLILGFKLFWNLRGWTLAKTRRISDKRYRKMPRMDVTGTVGQTDRQKFTNTLRWSPQIWQRWLPNKHMHADNLDKGQCKEFVPRWAPFVEAVTNGVKWGPYKWPYQWVTVLVFVHAISGVITGLIDSGII